MGVRGDLRLILTEWNRVLRNERLPTAGLISKTVSAIERNLNCGDSRIEISAAKCVLKMVEINQKDEHKFVDVRVQQEHSRLASVSAELGVDPSVIEHAAREANQIACGIEDSSRAPSTED